MPFGSKKPNEVSREGLSVRELLSGAIGKEDFNEKDVASLLSSKGVARKDSKKILKAYRTFSKSGLDYVLDPEGKTYNVFDKDGAITSSSKKAGNKSGFDVGDLLSLGTNMNKLVGFAANRIQDAPKREVSANNSETTEQEEVEIPMFKINRKPAIQPQKQSKPAANKPQGITAADLTSRMEEFEAEAAKIRERTAPYSKWSMTPGKKTRVSAASIPTSIKRFTSSLSKLPYKSMYANKGIRKGMPGEVNMRHVIDAYTRYLQQGNPEITDPKSIFDFYESGYMKVPTNDLSTMPLNQKRGGKIMQEGGPLFSERDLVSDPEIQLENQGGGFMDVMELFDMGLPENGPSGFAGMFDPASVQEGVFDSEAGGGGDGLLGTAGTVAKYALPFIGTSLANRMMDKTPKLEYKPVDLMTGTVYDLPRPNFGIGYQAPSGSDLHSDVIGKRFAEATQKEAEQNFNTQNAMSRIRQREGIMDRTNQNTMFNKNMEMSVDQFNTQSEGNKNFVKSQNLLDAFTGTHQNLQSDLAQKAALDAERESSWAYQVLRNPESLPGGTNDPAYKRAYSLMMRGLGLGNNQMGGSIRPKTKFNGNRERTNQ